MINDYHLANADCRLLPKLQVNRRTRERFPRRKLTSDLFSLSPSGYTDCDRCILLASHIDVFTLFSYLSRNSETSQRTASLASSTSYATFTRYADDCQFERRSTEECQPCGNNLRSRSRRKHVHRLESFTRKNNTRAKLTGQQICSLECQRQTSSEPVAMLLLLSKVTELN